MQYSMYKESNLRVGFNYKNALDGLLVLLLVNINDLLPRLIFHKIITNLNINSWIFLAPKIGQCDTQSLILCETFQPVQTFCVLAI